MNDRAKPNPRLRQALIVAVCVLAVLLFLCTMYLVSSTYNPFIYFRF